jgi:hypothetical protein
MFEVFVVRRFQTSNLELRTFFPAPSEIKLDGEDFGGKMRRPGDTRTRNK